MPTYKYNGKIRFVSTDFKLRVEPGEVFQTPYVLPEEWTDFELIDINTPPPVIPQTETLVVSGQVELDLKDYAVVNIVLNNNDSASLNIRCLDPSAPPIILDSNNSVWMAIKKTWHYFEKIYLTPRSGTPYVSVYKGFAHSGYEASGSPAINPTTPPPSVLSVTIGDYPTGQTAAKAGDIIQVTGTVETTATHVRLEDYEAFNQSDWIPVNSDGTFTIDGVVSSRTGTAMHARVTAIDSNGQTGSPLDSSNTIILDQTVPTFVDNGTVYPTGQTAFKGTESGTQSTTVQNFDTILYESPTGEFTIANPTVYEVDKTITLTNPGTYNDSTVNFKITATYAPTQAIATFEKVIVVADKAPVITVSQPQARLQTGPAPDGASYTITATSDQILTSAPDIGIPVSGTWQGTGFTGGPKVWTRIITVVDGDATGSGAWTLLNSPTNGAGLPATIVGTQVVGGFTERTLTIPAWPNRQVDIGVAVTSTAKLWCENLSKGGDGPNGGTIFTYSNTLDDAVNQYTIIDDTGQPNPNGHIWYNKDLANAVSNTSGTAQIIIREDP